MHKYTKTHKDTYIQIYKYTNKKTPNTGCLRKNALLGFLNPWDRLMPVVTIVLVKVVGEMLDDD